MPSPTTRTLVLVFVAATLLLTALLAPTALVLFLTHGLISAAILAAATGIGLLITAGRAFESYALTTRLILAAAVGTGTLSLLILIFGSIGVLNRAVWIALLTAFVLVGVWQFRRLIDAQSRNINDAPRVAPGASALRLLAVWPAVFLALAICAAAMPPGILWPAEGNGYDVLEYHLGAPREYFEAGRIGYLPHNIYSNFPFNVEMLYLLTMILHGDAVRAVYSAQALHLTLAALTVLAVWSVGTRISPRVGLAAAVAVGTVPFLVYLSGLAYVENGMTFFTAAALWSALSIHDAAPGALRRALIVGMLTGFAVGCKYTALPMVAVPIFVFCVLNAIRSKQRMAIPIVAAGLAITFAPWLIKNVANTGNPVFPLASQTFGYDAGVWNAEGETRWIEGHRPKPHEQTIDHRIGKLRDEILLSSQFGAIAPLGIAACIVAPILLGSKSREAQRLVIAGAILIVTTLYIWTFHTHLAGRFAVTLIVPCALMFALMFHESLPRPISRGAALLLLLATAANTGTAYRLLAGTGRDDSPNYLKADVFGMTAVLTAPESPISPHVAVLNDITRAGGRILMVADAKRFYLDRGVDDCVVFNRNPFADAAETKSPVDLLAWLRAQRYTHVYIDWVEMRRLRNSYGFWPAITPDLFARLEAVGLAAVRHIQRDPGSPPYATLFRLPAIDKPEIP